MKQCTTGLLAIMMLACTGCISVNAKVNTEGVSVGSSHLRHIVLFKFKKGTPVATIQEIEKGFGTMKENIPEIVALEWGVNVPENERNQGFTHALVITFRDQAGMDVYATHPAHVNVRNFALPHVEDVIVVDYWPRRS